MARTSAKCIQFGKSKIFRIASFEIEFRDLQAENVAALHSFAFGYFKNSKTHFAFITIVYRAFIAWKLINLKYL